MSRTRRPAARLALAALLLAAASPGGARAQTAPVDEIGGKQVPLTEGRWIAAGDAAGRLEPDRPLGGYGTIRNRVLLSPAADGKRIAAMAEVNVNEIGVEDGWGLAGECGQTPDPADSGVLVRAGWDASCWFVATRGWDWTAAATPAWRQAAALAEQRGYALPERTVSVGLRVANRRDVIDLRFHLAEAADMPPRESLPGWALVALGLLEAGLKHQLPEGRTLPAFDLPEEGLARSAIALERAGRLAELVAAKSLTPGEAEQQDAAMRTAERRESMHAFDPATVGFYRWLSFQSVAALSDASLTFLWTAQSLQAATVTLLQQTLRTGRTYIGRWVWSEVSTQDTRPDAARVVDFAYGGRPTGR